MGRPLKNIEEKRSVQIVIKLNRDEHLKLMDLVTYYEKSISECVRYLIFNPRPMPPKTSRVNIELLFQLKKLGINFNSYLKTVHQGKVKSTDESLNKSLLHLLNEIHKSLII